MTTNISRGEFGFPFVKTVPQETFVALNPEKYKSLLHFIAIGMGLNEKEARKLVEYACLIGARTYVNQKEKFTLKVWLSKILVHDCIFRISNEMFSQNVNTTDFSQASSSYLIAAPVCKIPISLRIVYILFLSAKFNELEMGQILNITPMQVKDRLAKAYISLKKLPL